MRIRNWSRVALFNFLLAAVLGALIRLAWVVELPWLDVRHATHAHSHVAILGWVYLALYACFVDAFVPSDRKEHAFYDIIFWLTQITVIGLLISFFLQGYGPASIAFLALHTGLSYFFAFRFLRDTRGRGNENESYRFARTALWFLILASLGLWALLPIMMSGLAGSEWYVLAIQFFLHFQLNGWLLFGALALFFFLSHRQDIRFEFRRLKVFHLWLVIATLPTFALALTWAEPEAWLFALNSLGVLIQLAALGFFFRAISPQWRSMGQNFRGWAGFLFRLALLAFTLKILVQTAVAIPYLATVAYTIRNLVIGFLHLLLLGIITPVLWAFGLQTGIFSSKGLVGKAALTMLVVGILTTEVVLFLQGVMFWGNMGFLPGYYELLFGLSAVLPLAVLIFLVNQFLFRPVSEL